MKFEELGLQIGDSLSLEMLSDAETRYTIKMIGYVPNKSFITTAAYIAPGRPAKFQEKQPCIIRFAVQNGVTGFKTAVLSMRTIPYPYLHFAMPDDVQMLEVRKAHRVRTKILATIDNLGDPDIKSVQGQIDDLSLSGVGLRTAEPIGEKEQKISIAFDCQIGEISKILVLKGILRAVTEKDEPKNKLPFCYGVQLLEIDEEDSIAMHAFIYQKILQKLHLIG